MLPKKKKAAYISSSGSRQPLENTIFSSAIRNHKTQCKSTFFLFCPFKFLKNLTLFLSLSLKPNIKAHQNIPEKKPKPFLFSLSFSLFRASTDAMETLSFLKFWRPTMKENQALNEDNDTTAAAAATAIEVEAAPSLVVCSESELDEGDDSFFELELTVSDCDNKKNTNSKESQQQTVTATLSSLSPTDVLSKRKILPIEPSSSSSLKAQSPISLLKSAPKLRVAIFKKPKSMATLKTEKTGVMEKTESTRKQNKLFTIKFRVEDASNLSMFTRASSLRKTKHKESIHTDSSSSSSSSSSKRFSKDVIQKYLKLIKPLYVRVSKKNGKTGFPEELTEASSSSPTASPAKKQKKGNIPAGFKHLSKSKSVSAAAVMSPARRDDSLLLQHDGIQSAILHCKNSFNSRGSKSFSFIKSLHV